MTLRRLNHGRRYSHSRAPIVAEQLPLGVRSWLSTRRRPIISDTTQSGPLLRLLSLVGPKLRPTRFRRLRNLSFSCRRHSPLLSGWFVIDDLHARWRRMGTI